MTKTVRPDDEVRLTKPCLRYFSFRCSEPRYLAGDPVTEKAPSVFSVMIKITNPGTLFTPQYSAVISII